MAKTVREIMNPELFSVREDEKAKDIVGYLLALGISAAPVLDEGHKPIGFVSLRDLVAAGEHDVVWRVMSTPADAIGVDETIDAAARLLATRHRHHVVVTGADGVAVGFVSILDVTRALLGMPAQHPSSFPHFDGVTGLSWTDAAPFDESFEAPAGPGVYMLLLSKPNEVDRVVWSEASADVRKRLDEVLSTPMAAPPHLASHLGKGDLLVRVAHAPSSRALLEQLKRRA